MTDLTDKVALVTGASQGIGAGIARSMAKYGADIVVNYLRSENLAQEVAADIRALGRRAHLTQADVMDFQAVQDMVLKIHVQAGIGMKCFAVNRDIQLIRF